MKKKFSLWFNIVTICLCLCAIAVGVYSASNASLSVTGQIGFTAHGCKLTIEGTLSGYATTDNATSVINGTKLTTVNLNNNSDDMALGNIYFSDLTGSAEIPQITLELEITNKSPYAVIGTVSVPATSGNLKITSSVPSIELAEDQAEGCTDTITLTFEVVNPNLPVNDIDLSTLTGLNISFDKNSTYSLTIIFDPYSSSYSLICIVNGTQEVTISHEYTTTEQTYVVPNIKTIQFKHADINTNKVIEIYENSSMSFGDLKAYIGDPNQGYETLSEVHTLSSNVTWYAYSHPYNASN